MPLPFNYSEIPLSPGIRGAIGKDVTAVRRFAGPTADWSNFLKTIFGDTQPGADFPNTEPYGAPTIVPAEPYPGTTILLPETFAVNQDSEVQNEVADLKDVALGSDCCVIDVSYKYQNCTGIPFFLGPGQEPTFASGTCLRVKPDPTIQAHTIPGRLLRFQAEPLAVTNGNAPVAPDDILSQDIFAAIPLDSERWIIEWTEVIQPNWEMIQSLKGKVNSVALWGWPSNAVLFESVSHTWYSDFNGYQRFNFRFNFLIETFPLSEGHTLVDPNAVVNDRMGRFNRSWSSKRWTDGVGDQYWRPIQTADGKPPFEGTNKLKDLFEYAP